MNMFNLDVTHKCLIAECWCPVSDLEAIQDALKRGTVSGRQHFIFEEYLAFTVQHLKPSLYMTKET